MSERHGNIVYTPPWVVADMIDTFAPSGRILDPCRGRGAFTDQLPRDTDWCEVTDGRDFFQWSQPVDWVIGNPPYSLTRKWFRHSYTIADHLLYLVPLRNVFSGYGFLREIDTFGGVVDLRVYGTGGKLGFPMGNAVGVFHIVRAYKGSTTFSFHEDAGADQLLLRETPGLKAEIDNMDSKHNTDSNRSRPVPRPPVADERGGDWFHEVGFMASRDLEVIEMVESFGGEYVYGRASHDPDGERQRATSRPPVADERGERTPQQQAVIDAIYAALQRGFLDDPMEHSWDELADAVMAAALASRDTEIERLREALAEARPYVFNRTGGADWRSETAQDVLSRVDALASTSDEEADG